MCHSTSQAAPWIDGSCFFATAHIFLPGQTRRKKGDPKKSVAMAIYMQRKADWRERERVREREREGWFLAVLCVSSAAAAAAAATL